MLLYLLAFVGGVLTIVSPCILPVLPFVFSRADQPFRRSGLPLLAGMAATFAIVTGIVTFAGAWVVRANQIGRFLAIVVFALLGLALLEAWSEKYKNDGLVVIGVHTPEFAFEKDPANVAKSLTDLKITYPVAIDSNYEIWKAFNNQYWPAHYFIDANGTIRFHHFGEGKYADGFVQVNAAGAQAAPDSKDVASPETYIGYARQQNYVSPQKIRQDGAQAYTAPSRLTVNQ
jgi:hypothetical protein